MTKFSTIFGLDDDERLDIIRSRVDVYDLCLNLGIQKLEIRGHELIGICPYHDDRRPSWSINVDQSSERWGLHSCWACKDSGGRGNIVTLTRYLKGLSTYDDALLWLEKFCKIDVSAVDRLDTSLDSRIRHIDSGCAVRRNLGIIFDSMIPLHYGSVGWNYLAGRGVTSDQIYARGVRMGKGRYRRRVVFPVWKDGNVVTFYARSVDDNVVPKGLYPKGKNTIRGVLFGYERAIFSHEWCYVAEGVFDVLAIERALKLLGYESSNVFATLGAVLHDDQAKLLKHFNHIVIIPDMKGQARSLVPSCKELLADKQLHTAEVDRGHDPDSVGLQRLAGVLRDPPLTRDKQLILKVDYGIYR